MQFVYGGSGIEYGSVEGRMKHETALRWVSKCCPSLPHSLINKLFRQRQVAWKSRSFILAMSKSMFQILCIDMNARPSVIPDWFSSLRKDEMEDVLMWKHQNIKTLFGANSVIMIDSRMKTLQTSSPEVWCKLSSGFGSIINYLHQLQLETCCMVLLSFTFHHKKIPREETRVWLLLHN